MRKKELQQENLRLRQELIDEIEANIVKNGEYQANLDSLRIDINSIRDQYEVDNQMLRSIVAAKMRHILQLDNRLEHCRIAMLDRGCSPEEYFNIVSGREWVDVDIETGIGPVCRHCGSLIDSHPDDHAPNCDWEEHQ